MIGSAVGVSLLLISIFIKSKQPPAMTISEGKLDIKSSIFQDMNEIDLDKVKKIEYKIKTYSSDDMQKTNRMLYFYDQNGSSLDSIDLNTYLVLILMIFTRKLVVRHLISNGFFQNKRKTSKSSFFSNHVDFVVELYFENLRSRIRLMI